MIRTQNIHSLTDFLRNAKSHIQSLKESKEPEVLTVNGRAEIVVQDAESYQTMLGELERLEIMEAVLEGQRDFEEGRFLTLEEVREQWKAKYGIQG
jgi:PHD/YefM family antitoxin component YafN of YafNO toxin-antitoxin module